MAVGKDHLARIVSGRTGLNLIDTKLLVAAFLDSVKDELSNGKRIELRGFGCFFVKECKALTARNPRNGEAVNVPKRKKPVFKISEKVIKKLNDKQE